jgi:hypothetical protein
MTCAQVLPNRFALGSHTKTADKVCNRWSRWVATAIVTRIDELFAIDAEARLPPKGSLRSSVRPGFLWKAVRLIRASFPWGGFSDESLESGETVTWKVLDRRNRNSSDPKVTTTRSG